MFAVSVSILKKAFLKDLPEMKPVDREGNGLRKEAGTADHGPEQQSPIMEPFFSNDPEDNDGPEERAAIVRPKSKGLLLFLGGMYSLRNVLTLS